MRGTVLISGSVVVASGALMVAASAIARGLVDPGIMYALGAAQDLGLITLIFGLGIVGLELVGLLEPLAAFVSRPARRLAGLPPQGGIPAA